MASALLGTDLDLLNKRTGKVRDLYDVTLASGEEALLIIATDRISAFDVVMQNGLPGKGIVLTQISKFWFDHFADTVPHHLISTDVADVPGLTDAQRDSLAGRIMLCRKTEVVPIECIARGYITGSGWKDYQRSGEVCGITLPEGLQNSDRLAEPLFTPSTKAVDGHDENISFAQGAEEVGEELMHWLGEKTLSLYSSARDYAASRGIILADTKFEFGQINGAGEPILIDEIFTPDSSRFWPADDWQPGREQASFDKQIVRNYLETVVASGEWDKTSPGPVLPDEVIERSIARYLEAYHLLTGEHLSL
ncbi:MAG: phosphoribosylaminoimidazolesuccinocarboxamide synthase [Gammaproteobacteria bacterium]|jgi:phosphoribosylaminoimidazole-succinocarboxamide synthase|nr:phosphoribosylaminoimidazolesuccinocarboxamide synthase [Gammaproteobacteria bacterium]MDA7723301.1 phosphoribosylaminoimidazolesuccinocarboxamide synthase [Pseudomonadales bacterium]MDC3409492.1 phosphoribosylaminoimidazolesuccinocarboxamide synthase [bacterium]MBT5333325.1 phosphoribosylaminoimidazolesuccinocarboxamide synthase [Gammaproteobacteria bacterium]MBT6023762.1 phosphoribosylaminoimidazolesuccinocarboxamide synthase [Gammaproteobacteria bacterium]